MREQDIEKILTHLKERYGIRKSVGYQVIMDVVTHQNSLTEFGDG